MELYQWLILAFAAIIVALYILQRVKGYNIFQHLMLAKPVVAAIASAVEAVSNISGNSTLKIIHVILRAGAESAEFAEKAWLIGDIEKEKRNEYAKTLTREVLTKAGIEITPQIETIVSGIIEVVCFLLPHSAEPEEENTEQTENE